MSPTTVVDARPATTGNPLDAVCTTPLKAGLRQLPGVIAEALRRAHGSQKAGAYTLDRDPGAFSRKLHSGRVTLDELEAQGGAFLGHLGDVLTEQWGAARVDPIDRAKALLLEVNQALAEVRR